MVFIINIALLLLLTKVVWSMLFYCVLIVGTFIYGHCLHILLLLLQLLHNITIIIVSVLVTKLLQQQGIKTDRKSVV